jgi:hypothetical protein
MAVRIVRQEDYRRKRLWQDFSLLWPNNGILPKTKNSRLLTLLPVVIT